MQAVAQVDPVILVDNRTLLCFLPGTAVIRIHASLLPVLEVASVYIHKVGDDNRLAAVEV